jgi:ribosomal protein S18 acetylase RimI-like enzyme
MWPKGFKVLYYNRIRNSQLSLHRVATIQDFSFVYSLYMHPVTNSWLLYELMDEGAFRPIFEELVNKKLLYIFMEGGKDCGMFKLVPQKYRNSHIIYLGGVAIDPAQQGRGLAATMIGEAMAVAEAGGFTRIELTVATINQKAIGVYEKAGFKTEGILKNYTYLASEKRYIDEQVMAYMITDYGLASLR